MAQQGIRTTTRQAKAAASLKLEDARKRLIKEIKHANGDRYASKLPTPSSIRTQRFIGNMFKSVSLTGTTLTQALKIVVDDLTDLEQIRTP